MRPDPDSRWGADTGAFDGYSLAGAESVARIFLPLVDHEGRRWSWREVTRQYRGSGNLDGCLTWAELSELPGDGSWAPPTSASPAGGIADAGFWSALAAVLGTADDIDSAWASEEHAVYCGQGSPLQRTRIGGTAGQTDEVTASRATAARDPDPDPDVATQASSLVVRASLSTLLPAWADARFPGWAWAVDGQLAIAAPPYADSVIVSGPGPVVDRLVASDLEALPVERWCTLPAMEG